MSLFHSMCKEYKVMIIWIMYDLCMNYMKPSDKSIDNTQVYNCGQLVAPLWWLNWPPRTISSGYLGRPQRWPLLPLSSTNISTTQEVSQIGKWAAGCRRRHLHLPTFAPLQLLFCLTRRPAPAAFLLLITVSSVFPLSPAACLAPTPVSNLDTLNWNIVCLADRLTLSQHNTPLTQTEHSLLQTLSSSKTKIDIDF